MDENTINEGELTEAERQDLLRIRREKLSTFIEAGKNPYDITKFDVKHTSEQILNNVARLNGKRVVIAGRIISKRIMGKASFAHILDAKGQIQIYVKIDSVGAEAYEDWKKYDIGDIIGVSGKVFVTHKGETSVAADKLTLLSLSLIHI